MLAETSALGGGAGQISLGGGGIARQSFDVADDPALGGRVGWRPPEGSAAHISMSPLLWLQLSCSYLKYTVTQHFISLHFCCAFSLCQGLGAGCWHPSPPRGPGLSQEPPGRQHSRGESPHVLPLWKKIMKTMSWMSHFW